MLRCCLLVALVGGCDLGEVGGEATGDGGTTEADANGAAAANYTSMILPLVTAQTCLVGGTCHMVQNPKLDSFANLQMSEMVFLPGGRYITKPSANSLLVKGPGSLVGGPGGMHQGITYFSAAQIATIAAFIDSL